MKFYLISSYLILSIWHVHPVSNFHKNMKSLKKQCPSLLDTAVVLVSLGHCITVLFTGVQMPQPSTQASILPHSLQIRAYPSSCTLTTQMYVEIFGSKNILRILQCNVLVMFSAGSFFGSRMFFLKGG